MVELVAADGSSLARRDTSATRLEFATADLPLRPDGPVYAYVTALDLVGTRLAVSDLVLVDGTGNRR